MALRSLPRSVGKGKEEKESLMSVMPVRTPMLFTYVRYGMSSQAKI